MANLGAFPLLRSALLASVAAFGIASHAQAFDTSEPSGVGFGISVPTPPVQYPLPITENYHNQTGKNAKGEEVRAYDDKDNPVIELLSGFNGGLTG